MKKVTYAEWMVKNSCAWLINSCCIRVNSFQLKQVHLPIRVKLLIILVFIIYIFLKVIEISLTSKFSGIFLTLFVNNSRTADIPANEMASEWSKLSITANVNCVGEKWARSGIPYGSLVIKKNWLGVEFHMAHYFLSTASFVELFFLLFLCSSCKIQVY